MAKKVLKKETPKVIELNPKSVIPALEQLLTLAKEGKIESFIFAGFSPDNLIVSSHADIDVIGQQHLTAFLQTEITLRAITEMFIVEDEDDEDDDDDDDDDNDDDK